MKPLLPTVDEVKLLARAIVGGLVDDCVAEYVAGPATDLTPWFERLDEHFERLLGRKVNVYRATGDDEFVHNRDVYNAFVIRLGALE